MKTGTIKTKEALIKTLCDCKISYSEMSTNELPQQTEVFKLINSAISLIQKDDVKTVS